MVNEFNDYLKVFQMDKPMVPLLYEHLKSIHSSLWEKVVVRKLFDENFSVEAMMNIELSNENSLKLCKNILNFVSKEALQKIENLSDEKMMEFKLIEVLQKIGFFYFYIEFKYQCRKFILQSSKKLIVI